jgi:hypothetical protein
MHKALKVTEHPDIVFRLLRFEPRPGGIKPPTAILGMLKADRK